MLKYYKITLSKIYCAILYLSGADFFEKKSAIQLILPNSEKKKSACKRLTKIKVNAKKEGSTGV